MHRYLASIRQRTDRLRPAEATGRTAGRGRALVAAALVASVLLPLAGGAATVASAAPTAPASVEYVNQADGAIRMALVPGESEARYIMTLRTLGQPPKTAVCTTRSVTGEIAMSPDGSILQESSKIVVDQRTLKCQAPLSDARAQTLLQTAQHPFAEFAVKSAPGLGAPLPTGDTAFQLVGDQTVKGQTRPVTYETTGTFTPEGMIGKARTTLPMSSFGITPPSLGPLLQVSDDMIAEVDIKAAMGAAMAGAPALAPAPAAEPAAEEAEAPAEETP